MQPVHANTISSCTTLGGTISCTGSLDTPADVFLETFTVGGVAPSITVQTFGFGGGTNAAGSLITAGGFASLVALFSGPVPTATVVTDGSGNPIASVPGSTQFSPGCPPAGTVSIGGSMICGDDTLAATLTSGTYTLLLSDASYIPFAVSPGPPISSLLSDGFADLTGGVFQTCNDSGACVSDTGNFAVDITVHPEAAIPEPGTRPLLACFLIILGGLGPRLFRAISSNGSEQTQADTPTSNSGGTK